MLLDDVLLSALVSPAISHGGDFAPSDMLARKFPLTGCGCCSDEKWIHRMERVRREFQNSNCAGCVGRSIAHELNCESK